MNPDRPPTIRDVARAAGLSRSVVSRVITGTGRFSADAKARTERAVAELGYRSNAAARTLRSGRSGAVGVLLRSVTSDFYSLLFQHLQAEASGDGVRIVGATGNAMPGSEEQALATLLEMRVDALVIGSGLLAQASIAEVAVRVPTVVVGRSGDDIVTAVVDDADAHARLTLQQLQSLGHRRVLFGRHPHAYTAIARTAAITAAAADYGVELVDIESGYDARHGIVLARRWASADATAIWTLGYDAAIGAMRALGEAGVSVPGDVSVVAADTNHLPRPFLPEVSGTCSEPAEVAAAVWGEVGRHLAGDAAARTVSVPVSFSQGTTLAAAN